MTFLSTHGATAKAAPRRSGSASLAMLAPAMMKPRTAARSLLLLKSGQCPVVLWSAAAAAGKAMAQKTTSVRMYARVPATPYFFSVAMLSIGRVLLAAGGDRLGVSASGGSRKACSSRDDARWRGLGAWLGADGASPSAPPCCTSAQQESSAARAVHIFVSRNKLCQDLKKLEKNFGQHLSRDTDPPGHENPAMGFFWGVDHH